MRPRCGGTSGCARTSSSGMSHRFLPSSTARSRHQIAVSAPAPGVDGLPPVEGEAVLPPVQGAAHRGRRPQEGTGGPGRGQVLPDGAGDPQVHLPRLRYQPPVHEPERPGPAGPERPGPAGPRARASWTSWARASCTSWARASWTSWAQSVLDQLGPERPGPDGPRASWTSWARASWTSWARASWTSWARLSGVQIMKANIFLYAAQFILPVIQQIAIFDHTKP